MNHELLVFSRREPHLIPVGIPRPRTLNLHLPDRESQGGRIGPKLQRLSETIENHRAVIQREIQGLEPESVIVFEVVGSVESFVIAVRTAGMEWMGDWDDIGSADDNFYIEGNRDRTLQQKLYFTMTDHAALQQMLNLWNIYQRGDQSFPRGLTGFRDVFARLRDVRLWDVRDRFVETGVADVWADLLRNHVETIRFEIELWYRDQEDKRREAESVVRGIIDSYGGRVISSSIYSEISYHGLLAECPAVGIREMMDNQDNALFDANQVMWIRATGQTLARSDLSEIAEEIMPESTLPAREPVVALFDGLPLSGHALIHDRIEINDIYSIEGQYEVLDRKHGTEMASIIIHGDLNNRQMPLSSLLYVCPILHPVRTVDGSVDEVVPDDKLFVDVIHEAVLEIVNNPAYNSIRIINLSIGDTRRPFSNVMSPTAKMLDYLSAEYGLLFVVSAGNATFRLDLPMTIGQYQALSDDEKYKAIYKYLWQQQADMRLLSPAESLNSITVGALSLDSSPASPNGTTLNIVPFGSVAPYSRYGGGFGRAIKPDIVNVGGQMFYSLLGTSSSNANFWPLANANKNVGPGIKTAAPSNGLTGTAYSCGTSHAAAMTTRLCADLYGKLRTIPNLNIPPEFEAVAVKAMLLHCCSWQQMGNDMKEMYVPLTGLQLRPGVAKWIGYGCPIPEISMSCTDQRVTLIGFGSLNQNEQVELDFPLPPCLVAQVVNKRLSITLAWMTPIASNRKDYREAKLVFSSPVDVIVDPGTVEADLYSTLRGTVQHEVFVGSSASTFERDGNLGIKVSCKKDDRLRSPVKYVIMATLEVPQVSQLPLYQEVSVKLQEQLQVGVL